MTVKLPRCAGNPGAEQPPRYVPVSRIRAAMKSTQFEEQAARGLPGGESLLAVRKLYPPVSGARAQILSRLGKRSSRPHRRDSCRERIGEMSSQDVLVLAEVQRGVLADVTLELLFGGAGNCCRRGWRRGGGGAQRGRGAAYAAPTRRGRPHRAGRRFAVGLLLLPAPTWPRWPEAVAAEKPKALLIAGTSIGWDLAPLLSAPLECPPS